MTNKELAKELLGYTYIDIQKIIEIYKMLNVNIEKFKNEYNNSFLKDLNISNPIIIKNPIDVDLASITTIGCNFIKSFNQSLDIIFLQQFLDLYQSKSINFLDIKSFNSLMHVSFVMFGRTKAIFNPSSSIVLIRLSLKPNSSIISFPLIGRW